jgi:hypothetical protein
MFTEQSTLNQFFVLIFHSYFLSLFFLPLFSVLNSLLLVISYIHQQIHTVRYKTYVTLRKLNVSAPKCHSQKLQIQKQYKHWYVNLCSTSTNTSTLVAQDHTRSHCTVKVDVFYVHVTVHRNRFLFYKTDALIFKIYFCQTLHVSWQK